MVFEVLARLWTHHDEQYRQSGFLSGGKDSQLKRQYQKKKKKTYIERLV